jgi:hypothetical protein
MVPLLLLLICAATTASTAVLCAVVIEKFGGVVGGIIATLPMTIVPYSVGYVVANSPDTQNMDTESALQHSFDCIFKVMFSVPIGIFTNMIYLFTWKHLPSLPIFSYCRERMSPRKQLFYLVPLAVCCWLASAVTFVLSLNQFDTVFHRRIIGLSFVGGSLIFGFSSIIFSPATSAPSSNLSPIYMNIARAVASAISIVVSLYISDYDAVISGITSVFPAVFTITIVSLWITHGQGVPTGALGPMILGTICVDVYAISFAEIHVRLYPLLNVSWIECAIISACISWFTAAIGWSIPIFFFVRWMKSRAKPQNEEWNEPYLSVEDYSLQYVKGLDTPPSNFEYGK